MKTEIELTANGVTSRLLVDGRCTVKLVSGELEYGEDILVASKQAKHVDAVLAEQVLNRFDLNQHRVRSMTAVDVWALLYPGDVPTHGEATKLGIVLRSFFGEAKRTRANGKFGRFYLLPEPKSANLMESLL